MGKNKGLRIVAPLLLHIKASGINYSTSPHKLQFATYHIIWGIPRVWYTGYTKKFLYSPLPFFPNVQFPLSSLWHKSSETPLVTLTEKLHRSLLILIKDRKREADEKGRTAHAISSLIYKKN